MIKGSLAKEEIFNKMIEIFEGAFLNNGGKELRIPWTENGEFMQIKCTLVRANDIVEVDESAAVPGETKSTSKFPPVVKTEKVETEKEKVEPTQAELDKVAELWKKILG